MISLENFSKIYFIGIGGIGMSAIARYFVAIGKKVAGYDRSPSNLTENLQKEGINIHFEDDISLIPQEFHSKNETLVVFTPAIPVEHSEFQFFQKNQFSILKRAEILGFLTQNEKVIAISGTHGKTTTTTLTSHILLQGKRNISAFLGGISKNYRNNLLLSNKILYNSDEKQKNEFIVVEADEYDRSFWQLFPYIAVVTSTDADHLDIYHSHDEVKNAFLKFISQIHPEGKLIRKKNISLPQTSHPKEQYIYSLDSEADFFAKNFRLINRRYHFDIVTPTFIMEDVTLEVQGKVNIENAIAAVAVAYLVGLDEDSIRNALQNFNGVERRFDFQIDRDHLIYVDDYAHHPAELNAFITSMRGIFTDKKITGIFQPHLFTRTRDFAEEFAQALSLLDEVILLEIYPARETPIEGVTSQMLFDKISLKEKYLCSKNELIEFLKKRKFEVLLTMGAGDIDKMVKPIKEILEQA